MIAVVSTIDGHHFVRLFPDKDRAMRWVGEWIADEDEFGGIAPTSEDGLYGWAQGLGLSEWLFLQEVDVDPSLQPLASSSTDTPELKTQVMIVQAYLCLQCNSTAAKKYLAQDLREGLARNLTE